MKETVQFDGEKSTSSQSLHQRLNAYALAASAAGVSLLALSEPSAAEIIYTHTHHVIRWEGSYKLDFNHDGTTDLTIQNKYFHTCTTFDGSCFTSETLAAALVGNNAVVYNWYGAVAMKPGMRIGPRDKFKGGSEPMVKCANGIYPVGSWINVRDRYLGVKFKIKGETHYGWARLSVHIQLPITITTILTGYAYETIPNKPIISGKTKGPDVVTVEPGSLGALAAGRK
jgi:hypothetical protein